MELRSKPGCGRPPSASASRKKPTCAWWRNISWALNGDFDCLASSFTRTPGHGFPHLEIGAAPTALVWHGGGVIEEGLHNLWPRPNWSAKELKSATMHFSAPWIMRDGQLWIGLSSSGRQFSKTLILVKVVGLSMLTMRTTMIGWEDLLWSPDSGQSTVLIDHLSHSQRTLKLFNSSPNTAEW